MNVDTINLLTNVSTHYLNKGNYDYLTGGLGSALCLSKGASSIKEKDGLRIILNLLSKSLEIEHNTYEVNNKPNSIDNLSLSHGVSSVISILTSAQEINVDNESNIKLINDALSWLITNKNEDGLSLYPNLSTDEKPYSSRLAWCYGDLGIASVLWRAGKVLKNKEWEKEAITIMLNCSKRRDLKENYVLDACICHGTSGIAHIFNRFFKETGIYEFNEARWFWLQKTLEQATWNNDLADYKTWQGENGWQNETGILEGISGIGLVLLGFLTNDIRNLSWDECLLLS